MITSHAGPDAPVTTLAALLAEARLEDAHLEGTTLRSLHATYVEGGRAALLDNLKAAGVSTPPARSAIANALSKADSGSSANASTRKLVNSLSCFSLIVPMTL